jgi:hypothetical protein
MTSCVSVSLAIGILYCVGAASLPPPPQPHLGHAAGGAESRGATHAWNGHSTALFAYECQSFLDNVIAGLRRTGGAELAITGTVQKVSNLILNMNIYVRDASTGATIAAMSADMRGNTDETWSRTLDWLVRNRLLAPGYGLQR